MLSQWDCLLKNLGSWQGSFTRFSFLGETLEDVPSIVSLEGINNNRTIRQIVRRFPEDKPPEELVLEYSSLGQGILLADTGAFSQGSLFWSPITSGFGTELGLIDAGRRVRLVQLFDNRGCIDRLTLIRERLEDSLEPEKPPLTVGDLVGEWRGEATTIGRDFYPAAPYSTRLTIEREGNYLHQKLSFAGGSIASTARIDGRRLLFENSTLPVQILLLPDGVSCNTPLQIKSGHRFVLELGWLISPTRRQRLIRSYNEKGEWVNLTLVREERVS